MRRKAFPSSSFLFLWKTSHVTQNLLKIVHSRKEYLIVLKGESGRITALFGDLGQESSIDNLTIDIAIFISADVPQTERQLISRLPFLEFFAIQNQADINVRIRIGKTMGQGSTQQDCLNIGIFFILLYKLL